MEKYERWQALLGLLRGELDKKTNAALARRIGKDPSYVNRLFYPRSKDGSKAVGTEITDACNTAFKLPLGFWDMDVASAKEALAGRSGSQQPSSSPTVTPGSIEAAYDILAATLHVIGEAKSAVVLAATAIHAKDPETERGARESALSLLLGRGGGSGEPNETTPPLKPTGTD